ncbi:MAG: HNH endonuclease [Nitrospirae bacterium]|nr:HNH endonuclease [Nitrospirota bacterium]
MGLSFIQEVADEEINRQRSTARSLRQTSWWKRKRSEGKCYYCGMAVNPSELTMDHVVPLIRGGKSIRSNIVAACKECNTKKKYMLPIEWGEYLNRLSS